MSDFVQDPNDCRVWVPTSTPSDDRRRLDARESLDRAEAQLESMTPSPDAGQVATDEELDFWRGSLEAPNRTAFRRILARLDKALAERGEFREALFELKMWVDNWDCPFKDQDDSGEWDKFEPTVNALLKSLNDTWR